MVGQNSAGFIVIEKDKYHGMPVNVCKVINIDKKDYMTHSYKYNGKEVLDKSEEKFESTSFVCKNSDKVQVVAFGGNDCTEIEMVEKLSGVVDKIFNQTTIEDKNRKGKDVNVTAIGYTIKPLLNDGDNIEQSYNYPLEVLARRIFNTDGTIEDIKNRVSNTILFSHCVGGECVDKIIDTLEYELRKKNATESEINEVLNALISINYAKYVPQQGAKRSKIPTVNLFQVYDSNDGSVLMREDVSTQDSKKIGRLLGKCKKQMSFVSEVKNWNGAIMWNNESGNTLNISLDKLKTKGGKVHNPSELIIHCDNAESSPCLIQFMESFNEWRNEIIEGKHKDTVKISVLRQKLSQMSLGKQF